MAAAPNSSGQPSGDGDDTKKKLAADFTYLVMQWLKENNYTKAYHSLEEDSKLVVSVEHVEALIQNGRWASVTEYLGAFFQQDDPAYHEILEGIYRHRLLEALEIHDYHEARRAISDITSVRRYNPVDFAEYMLVEDIRKHPDVASSLARIGPDATIRSARFVCALNVVKQIKAHPDMGKERTEFPKIEPSRLKKLVTLFFRHQHRNKCGPLGQQPLEKYLTTLLKDHQCPLPSSSSSSTPSSTSPSTPDQTTPPPSSSSSSSSSSSLSSNNNNNNNNTSNGLTPNGISGPLKSRSTEHHDEPKNKRPRQEPASPAPPSSSSSSSSFSTTSTSSTIPTTKITTTTNHTLSSQHIPVIAPSSTPSHRVSLQRVSMNYPTATRTQT
eukprot:TRINITY_DN7496_c0_g1_i1.p1 TRINITY_DN7496_c0_g1~~TRINITY_DN7496_c0_g1_i1.p1  ORF type:complete len:391 (+),score=135.81 TRINITY_DN7496_c0_g1_i1:22-1173(+)